MITLSPLADAAPDDVERLLDSAFGTDRHSRTAYRIRAGMAPIADLSLAAWEADRLIGTLQSWPVALHGLEGETPLVLVGPVAVDPDRQQRGIGRLMMDAMLSRAASHPPLVLIGDPEYYGRHFDFTADATAGWKAPGPFEHRRLLARTGGRALPLDGMLGPRRETKTSDLR
ncbi:GNAT family N-acetyltransferase [Sphingomonas sp.]|uniref:GNAT family N-acetyltransferase n=1 Tax=Sphingomonas sp. TaxID=28214 RepID=UPI003B3A9DCB